MNKFTQLLLGVISLLCCQNGSAQQDYDILLQTVSIGDEDKAPLDPVAQRTLAGYQFDGRFFFILQFDDLPDAALQMALQRMGVDLLDYVPNFAYWAAIPAETDLEKLPVRSIILPKPSYKLARSLYHEITSSETESTSLVLRVFPFPSVPRERLAEELGKKGFATEQGSDGGLRLQVRTDQVPALAACPAIMYLEIPPPEPVAEDVSARSLHGIQALSAGPQLGWNGEGVVITTADDGVAIHPDLKNRVIPHLERDAPAHHSDMVLGILTGAGNIDPLAIGTAPGATVHLFDIQTTDHLGQAVDNFNTYGATITTTAYAEGCGGRYESSARAIDDQVHKNPHLLHCFSAGNEADENCSDVYGRQADEEGYFFGNITGGRKAAKNVIAVGNLHYNDQLMRLSSRGPADDGRIKPDLCAYGQGQQTLYPEDAYQTGGGTSAAVPVVAGAAAVLTQLYREETGEKNLPSDLLKPAMLNTTEDLGAPGPDFKYGWGRLQAQRAAEVLRRRQYLRASISHGRENIHKIDIPDDAQDLRIMVYWHDPAANPTAGKALVNDLDLTVQSPAGDILLPWTVRTAAHKDSLNNPAYRGVDRLNNVEQVTLDLPNGGQYQVRVRGQIVPKGPQVYYVVYSYRRQALKLTYPLGGEGFVPGETQVLRWEAFGTEAPFDLEYRIGGGRWQPIVTNLAKGHRYYNWRVPESVHGLAEIRIRSGDLEHSLEEPFSIMDTPDFEFLHRDAHSAWIQWEPVPGADHYEVFMLGDKYMDVIESTPDTRLLIQPDPEKIYWYSVRARKSGGAVGRRALAKRYLNLPCLASVHLKINFDAYPSETQWQLRDEAGAVVAKGGPYKRQRPNTAMEQTLCLPYGCYELTMMDSYGDGLCCQSGSGGYEMTDETGRVLASGGRFVREELTSFCLEAPPEPVPAPFPPLALTLEDSRPVSCAGGDDGELVVRAEGGSGNYTFLWSNGQQGPILQDVGVGNYQVTVMDGNESLIRQFQVNEPAPIHVSFEIFSDDCRPQTPKEIKSSVRGGQSPYSFLWSNGSRQQDIDGLNAGQYALTVTDLNGCQATGSVSIETATSLTLDMQIQQPRCAGDANGQITTTLAGGRPPYQYLWNTGQTATSLSGLPPGDYRLTVTDANGCWIIGQARLLEPSAIQLEGIVTPVSDNGAGRIKLQVSGGVPSYQYQWADGAVVADRAGLFAGEYTVTVSDNKGCTRSRTFVVADESSGSVTAYCSSSGVFADREWVEAVWVNGVVFPSGSNGGYKDHTAYPAEVTTGEMLRLQLVRGRTTNSNLHYWSVWIDFDQNGRFDGPGELVFQNDLLQDVHQAEIWIPAGLSGTLRMRVAIQWGAPPAPCGNPTWGEVEDFTLRLVPSASVAGSRTIQMVPQESPFEATPHLRIAPNPARSDFQLTYTQLPQGPGTLVMMNVRGQVVQRWDWEEEGQGGSRRLQLPQNVPPGLYLLRLQIGSWFGVERLVVH